MKLQTTTSARFTLSATDQHTFDVGCAFVLLAAKRSNIGFGKTMTSTTSLTNTAKSCIVTLTCDDADYLLKLGNDLKAALQLINVTTSTPGD